jgi:hypothetical protein
MLSPESGCLRNYMPGMLRAQPNFEGDKKPAEGRVWGPVQARLAAISGACQLRTL